MNGSVTATCNSPARNGTQCRAVGYDATVGHHAVVKRNHNIIVGHHRQAGVLACTTGVRAGCVVRRVSAARAGVRACMRARACACAGARVCVGFSEGGAGQRIRGIATAPLRCATDCCAAAVCDRHVRQARTKALCATDCCPRCTAGGADLAGELDHRIVAGERTSNHRLGAQEQRLPVGTSISYMGTGIIAISAQIIRRRMQPIVPLVIAANRR